MQAIIFANRQGHELAPLNNHYCPALLPVANKALIEYTLEDLAQAGISHVKMVISAQADHIEQHLKSGAKWGMQIEYFLSKSEEDVSAVLTRMKLDKQHTQLVLRGDILRTPCMSRFTEFSKQVKQTYVSAKMNQQNPGVLMLPAGWKHGSSLNWPMPQKQSSTLATDTNKMINQVLHGECFYLDSFENYFNANQYVITHAALFNLKGRKHPTAAGVLANDATNATADQGAMYIEPQSHHPAFSKKNVVGAIGRCSHIDKQVQAQGTVIIAEHCIIERSELQNCVILPGTFLGQDLQVKGSIISKNIIIDIAKGTWVKVSDPLLMGASQPITTSSSTLTRLLALLLFITTLPLMALGLVVALFQNPLRPIRAINGTSNQQQLITLHELAINQPILAKLPQLWHVINGELQLFGASATASQQHAKYGVFGPVQIWLNKDAPLEEVELVEMEFQQLSQFGYLRKLITLAA